MESILRACLAEAASTTSWCDVHVCCGGRLFKAHRVVLSSVSTFLRNLLLSRSEGDNPSTILLPDFTENAMSAVMSYIYNGEVSIPNTILIEFLNIINVLQISIDKRYFEYLRNQIDMDQIYSASVGKCKADEIKNSTYTNTAGRHEYGSREQHCNHMDLEAVIESDRISKGFSTTVYDTDDSSNKFEPKVKSDTVLKSFAKMYVACTDRRREDEEKQNVCDARDSGEECPLLVVDKETCVANCVPTIANETNLCSTSLDGGMECSSASVDIRHTSTKSYAVCANAQDVNANSQNTEITFSLQNNCNDVLYANNLSRSSELKDNDCKYSGCNRIETNSDPEYCIQYDSVESSVSHNDIVNHNVNYNNASLLLSRVGRGYLPKAAHSVRTNVLPLKPTSYRFDKSTIKQNDSRLKEGSILRPVPSLLPITSDMNFVQTKHYGFRKIPDLLDLSINSLTKNNTIGPEDVAENYRSNFSSGKYGNHDFSPMNRYCGSNGLSINSEPHYGLTSRGKPSNFPAVRLGKRSAYNKVIASPWSTRGPICYRRNRSIETFLDIYPYTTAATVTYDNTCDKYERDIDVDNNDSNNKTTVDVDNNGTGERIDLTPNDKNNNLTTLNVEEDSNDLKTYTLPSLERLTSAESISNRGFKESPVKINDKNEEILTTLVSDGNLRNPHSIDKIMMGTTKCNVILDVKDNCAMKCEICSKMFTSKTTMEAHVKSHSSQGRYHCDQCDKSFSQLRNYKYHVSVHRGTKEFAATCNVCGKYFNDRGYLSSHMKIHRNRKEYQCPHCPKSFNQRVAYNMHVRIHTGVKPHVCESCGKAFSRKMLLKQHQRTHSGEKPYACAACGKRFADRSNMTLHARLHSGVKPFSCTMCPKSFTKKHHLKTHLNYHTGNKPYACERCGLAFSQSSNMRTHMKKCIPKVGMEAISEDKIIVSSSNNL